MNRLKSTIAKMGKMAPITTPAKPSQNPSSGSAGTSTHSGNYRKLHKSGPELLVTRILMVNGPLTSKEIWKIY
jgi:hypothetical protein